MKRPCFPILIASVFLLNVALTISAASAYSPASTNQQQGQTGKDRHGAKHRATTPISPPFPLVAQAQPNTEPQTQPTDAETEHWYDRFWPPRFETVFPPIWSNWALVIAATVAAIIGLCTLDAIRRSNRIAIRVARATKVASMATKQYVQMTTQMIEAAKQSARAAELALNAERPDLFVESQQLRVSEFRPISLSQPLTALGNEPKTEARGMQIDVGFDIRNRGKGVAVFDHVSIRMILIEESLSFRRPYKFIKAGFAQQFMRARIIGSAESASCDSTGLRLSKDQWDRVKAMRLGIIVRVTVFYEDVFKRKFWSKFTFEFNPPTPASEYLGLSIPALGGFLMSSPRPRQTRFK